MSSLKDSVVHDLAMACVHGVVMDKVMKENRDDFPCDLSAVSFSDDVMEAYKEAWALIYPYIDITETDD